jgi:GntR family transcriptional regulator
MPLGIDKLSAMPLYIQLAESLEKSIQGGQYSIGSKIPPEEELAQRFELNRNTVRHAISLMVDRGILVKKRGIGTFVRRKQNIYPVHRLDQMVSFVDDFNIGDIRIDDWIIDKSAIQATPEIAALLQLEEGGKAVRIERLRLAEGTPFVLETQYYSYQEFGRLLEIPIKGSMYKILSEQFHADLDHAVQTIRAVLASQETAQKLSIAPAVPCLYIESLAYNSENRCIEILHSYYRGDRYLFRVQTGAYSHGIRVDREE